MWKSLDDHCLHKRVINNTKKEYKVTEVWLLLPPLLIGLRVLYVVGLAMQAWSLLSWKVPESRDGAEMNELCEVDGIFQTV